MNAVKMFLFNPRVGLPEAALVGAVAVDETTNTIWVRRENDWQRITSLPVDDLLRFRVRSDKESADE